MSKLSIRRSRRSITGLYLALALTTIAALAWVRGEQTVDDRGSDSSEKALMIILAIGLGTVVSVAAIAFVNSKTALFH